MPSLFNPNGTVPHATAPGIVQIASSTLTTPITVNTVVPHGYNDGDTVFNEGHLNNTNVNGRYQIHVTGASSFTLIGSVGVGGPGAMTGYCSNYSVNPLLTIPSDGDLVSGGNANPPVEAVADAIPFLNERVGAYRCFAMTRLAKSDDMGAGGGGAASFASVSATPSGTWTHVTGAAWPYTNAASIPYNLGLHDIIMLDFSCRGVIGGASFCGFALDVSFDSGSTRLLIPGSTIQYDNTTDTVVRLCAMFVVSDLIGAGTPNSAIFGVMGQTANAPQTVTLYPPYHLTAAHFRNNYAAVQ